jgi:hypothetical protein
MLYGARAIDGDCAQHRIAAALLQKFDAPKWHPITPKCSLHSMFLASQITRMHSASKRVKLQ